VAWISLAEIDQNGTEGMKFKPPAKLSSDLNNSALAEFVSKAELEPTREGITLFGLGLCKIIQYYKKRTIR